MPALDNVAKAELALLRQKSLLRTLKGSQREEGVVVRRGKRDFISFSCNDYFGLSHHPHVIAAAQEALVQYGAGAGASRLVTGNHPLYDALEKKLAAVKGTEAALVFGSGYLANLGVIPALAGKNDLILADRLIHACMIDGAKLSGAVFMRFAHNNLDHCRLLLEEHRGEFERCLILTETVFSMDGDLAPIADLAKLAKKHDAWLLTDDAHGLGLIPPGGIHADIQMGTLSKGAGAYGGYVCASRPVIDFLVNSARSLVFSTALPPSVIAAATESLAIMRKDKKLTQKPLQHARTFTRLLGKKKAESAIVPVMLGEPERALEASARLEEEGFLVAAIRPPTVPQGTARLRFAFSALHEAEHIGRVASLLKKFGYA